jgi:hypothetical protein
VIRGWAHARQPGGARGNQSVTHDGKPIKRISLAPGHVGRAGYGDAFRSTPQGDMWTRHAPWLFWCRPTESLGRWVITPGIGCPAQQDIRA